MKSTLAQATKAQRGSRCITTLPLTSAIDGAGGQRRVLPALPPGKTRYLLYRRLCWPQGRSGRVRNISPPPGFHPRTVQPVASRYTDCAIPAHQKTTVWCETFALISVCYQDLHLSIALCRLGMSVRIVCNTSTLIHPAWLV